MHAPGSFVVASAKIFLLHVSIVATYPTTGSTYWNINLPRKCCPSDYAFNDDLKCVLLAPYQLYYATRDVRQTVSSQQSRYRIVTAIEGDRSMQGLNCHDDVDTSDHRFRHTYVTDPYESRKYCFERMINGTAMLVKCPSSNTVATDKNESAGTMKTTIAIVSTTTTTVIATNLSSIVLSRENKNERFVCGEPNVLNGSYVMYGTVEHVRMGMVITILCAIVVVVYFIVPELGKNLYNRAVLRHNISLLFVGFFAFLPGLCGMRRCLINDGNFIVFVWVVTQFFMNATGLWLNVICFDMTMSITRFRWIAGIRPESGLRIQEENRRLLLYSFFVWGSSLLSVIVALFFEYCPGIPKDFPLRPCYPPYITRVKVMLHFYIFFLPLLALFCNNILFLFTMCKIVCIKRNTKMATQNCNKSDAPGKKTFLYLELYLVMGSPWFFGVLFTILRGILIMRICYVMQPIISLVMLFTNKNIRQKFISKLQSFKRRSNTISS